MKSNKPPYTNTYSNRVAQFQKEQPSTVSSVNENATNSSSENEKNPYKKARLKILQEYPEWRKNEVLQLENNGEINHKHYITFVKEIAVLGDTFYAGKSE